MGLFGYSIKKTKRPVNKQFIQPTVDMVLRGLGKVGASYIDINTRKQYAEVFSTTSEVYSPIIYAAKAFSNMKVKLFSVEKDGEKEILNHDLLTKLQSPNPLSNWKDFLIHYYVNKKVFGNGYIYKYNPLSFNEISDSVLWVLPSQFMYPVPASNLKLFTGINKEDFIKGYQFNNQLDLTKPISWTPDKIMHQKEVNICLDSGIKSFNSELLEGRSALSTLSEPVSNIKKAYDAQNVIMSKFGALGLLSPKNRTSKDMLGVVDSVVMEPDERQRLQDEIQLYGLGRDQFQILIAKQEMVWQQMSLPLKDLLLFEGIQENFIAICNAFNFPILLLNYLAGATYSNVNEIKKSLYQDNIIPEAESFVSEFNSFLGLPEQNLILRPDFSHVPILQADSKTEAEKDAITVDTIRGINSDIFEGKLTNDAGINILADILSIPPESAGTYLIDSPNNNNNNE